MRRFGMAILIRSDGGVMLAPVRRVSVHVSTMPRSMQVTQIDVQYLCVRFEGHARFERTRKDDAALTKFNQQDRVAFGDRPTSRPWSNFSCHIKIGVDHIEIGFTLVQALSGVRGNFDGS